MVFKAVFGVLVYFNPKVPKSRFICLQKQPCEDGSTLIFPFLRLRAFRGAFRRFNVYLSIKHMKRVPEVARAHKRAFKREAQKSKRMEREGTQRARTVANSATMRENGSDLSV